MVSQHSHNDAQLCNPNYIWLLLSVAWLLVLSGCALGEPAPTPVPAGTDIPNWRGIYPGISTERDVRRILGRPAETERMQLFNEENRLVYPGTYDAHPIDILIDADRDRVLSIIVPTYADRSLRRTGEDIIIEYGQPEVIVGGYFPRRNVVTYLYAQKGIALSVFYRGDNPALNGIMQVEFFEPMPTQDWLDTWGEIYRVGEVLDLEPFHMPTQVAPTATITPLVTAIPASPSSTPQPTYTRRATLTPTPLPSLSGSVVFCSKREDTNGDGMIGVGDGQHLYTMDLTTGETVALTSGEYFDTDPSWSPDGTQVVFASNRTDDGGFELFVVNRDGSDLHQLTNIPESARYPVWSPDGAHIAFVMGHQADNGYYDETQDIGLYIVAAETVQQLTTSIDLLEYSEGPSWSPDGRYLAFYHIGKSSSGESEYASSIQLIDIETLERYWLVQDARLSLGIRNPEWVPGEGYIISWEFERGVDTPNRELHTFEIRWENGVPTLRQLPIVLNDLQGPAVWTLNGEFALFMAFNNSIDDGEVYEIATLPINLASYLHVEDAQPTTISLAPYNQKGRIQFLTDNHFLDHLHAWTP